MTTSTWFRAASVAATMLLASGAAHATDADSAHTAIRRALAQPATRAATRRQGAHPARALTRTPAEVHARGAWNVAVADTHAATAHDLSGRAHMATVTYACAPQGQREQDRFGINVAHIMTETVHASAAEAHGEMAAWHAAMGDATEGDEAANHRTAATSHRAAQTAHRSANTAHRRVSDASESFVVDASRRAHESSTAALASSRTARTHSAAVLPLPNDAP